MSQDDLFEVPPAWKRLPESNGSMRPDRNTNAEEQYKTDYNQLREQCKQLIALCNEKDRKIADLRQQIGERNRELEISHGENRTLQKDMKELEAKAYILGIVKQLQLLMPESELQPTEGDPERFTNTYGTFKFNTIGSYVSSLTVQPRPDVKLNQEFVLNFYDHHFTDGQIAELRGRLEFSGNYLPEDAKPFLRRDNEDMLSELMEKQMESLPPELKMALMIAAFGSEE